MSPTLTLTLTLILALTLTLTLTLALALALALAHPDTVAIIFTNDNDLSLWRQSPRRNAWLESGVRSTPCPAPNLQSIPPLHAACIAIACRLPPPGQHLNPHRIPSF